MSIRLLRGILVLALVICAVSLAILGISKINRAQVIIEWETASEIETVGFNIYRKASTGVELTRINEELIPSSPDPWAGGEYSFVDTDLSPGVTYSYYLEDVSESGTVTMNGPIEVIASRGGRAELLISFLITFLALLVWYSSKRLDKPKMMVVDEVRDV
jgi:hypothetical protein